MISEAITDTNNLIPTKPDGYCFFHALFGEVQENKWECANYQEKIVELKRAINNIFNDPQNPDNPLINKIITDEIKRFIEKESKHILFEKDGSPYKDVFTPLKKKYNDYLHEKELKIKEIDVSVAEYIKKNEDLLAAFMLYGGFDGNVDNEKIIKLLQKIKCENGGFFNGILDENTELLTLENAREKIIFTNFNWGNLSDKSLRAEVWDYITYRNFSWVSIPEVKIIAKIFNVSIELFVADNHETKIINPSQSTLQFIKLSDQHYQKITASPLSDKASSLSSSSSSVVANDRFELPVIPIDNIFSTGVHYVVDERQQRSVPVLVKSIFEQESQNLFNNIGEKRSHFSEENDNNSKRQKIDFPEPEDSNISMEDENELNEQEIKGMIKKGKVEQLEVAIGQSKTRFKHFLNENDHIVKGAIDKCLKRIGTDKYINMVTILTNNCFNKIETIKYCFEQLANKQKNYQKEAVALLIRAILGIEEKDVKNTPYNFLLLEILAAEKYGDLVSALLDANLIPSTMVNAQIGVKLPKHANQLENNTPLHFAIYQKNIDLISKLLAMNGDATLKNSNGLAPIHCLIVGLDNIDDLKGLLSQCNPEIISHITNSSGMNALQLAVYLKKVEVAKLLIEQNSASIAFCTNQPNAYIFSKFTALQIAVTLGLLDLTQYIFEKFPQFISLGDRSLLQIAAQYQRVELVQYILKNSNLNIQYLDSSNFTALDYAVKYFNNNNNLKLIQVLKNAGAVASPATKQLAFSNLQNDHQHKVAGFLLGLIPDSKYPHVLHRSILQKKSIAEVINLVTPENTSALLFATDNENNNIFHWLFNHNIFDIPTLERINEKITSYFINLLFNRNAKGIPAIAIAIEKMSLSEITLFFDFLKRRFSHQNGIINQLVSSVIDEEGNNLLHKIAKKPLTLSNEQPINIFENFLSKEVSLSQAFCVKNTKGETALHLAIQHSNFTLASFILKTNPILLMESDRQGYTPLHLALSKLTHQGMILGLIKFVSEILVQIEDNKKINLQDTNGNTIGHFLSKVIGDVPQLDKRIKDILLYKNLNCYMRNQDGESILDVIEQKNSEHVQQILQQQQASLNCNLFELNEDDFKCAFDRYFTRYLSKLDANKNSIFHCAMLSKNNAYIKYVFDAIINSDNLGLLYGKNAANYTVFEVVLLTKNFEIALYMMDTFITYDINPRKFQFTENCLWRNYFHLALAEANQGTPHNEDLLITIIAKLTTILASLPNTVDLIKEKRNDGQNLLHRAAALGCNKLLDLLLTTYHFDINEKDTLNQSALHFAVRDRKFDTINFLLENKIIVDKNVSEKISILHYIASYIDESDINRFLSCIPLDTDEIQNFALRNNAALLLDVIKSKNQTMTRFLLKHVSEKPSVLEGLADNIFMTMIESKYQEYDIEFLKKELHFFQDFMNHVSSKKNDEGDNICFVALKNGDYDVINHLLVFDINLME